ncbi:MAG: hypothetical protein JXB06_13270, partial [Spirochaetales bacterium]|nr:hypothetical protein [Spirochaetales bacterium]
SAAGQDSAAEPVDPAELLKFVGQSGVLHENSAWDRIESLRARKRRSNLQVHELLDTVAAAGRGGATGRPGKSERAGEEKLQITSISMAGSVTLIGIDSRAAFLEGRLSGLVDRGRSILPGVPARSFFSFGARRESLRTDSAFSFDREGQTGLRCTLSTRSTPGPGGVRVILDYYFTDEPNRLTLDMTVHYPELPPGIIRESSPLEACLCAFDEDEQLQIEVLIPNREPYRRNLASRQGVYLLYGKCFTIPRDRAAVQLTAYPAHSTRTEWIEFRVAKQRGTYQLWANLGGSYLVQPASLLSARRRSLSYSIGSPERR